MKKLVFYYYCLFLLINIFSTMVFGYVTHDVIQPGLFIHGGMLLLLVVFFFKQKKSKLTKKISNIILGFTIVFVINLFVVEIFQLGVSNIYASLNYAFKIYLFLFLSYYTIKNFHYFNKRVDTILLVNTVIVLSNIILGYIFQIGGQSYGRLLEDSYRGFLAANDTSMFSFVAFGFCLYSLDRTRGSKRSIIIILLIASLFSMYIIATKAVFVAGIVIILYLYQKRRWKVIFLFAILASVILFFNLSKEFSPIVERLFKNYDSALAQSGRMLEQMKDLPQYTRYLALVAPGRIIIGLSMLITLATGSLINILIGYGVSGIYYAFGRPPMMDFFNIIGYFGIIGFIVFYLPQLKVFLALIRLRKFDMVEVLFLMIFLYGSIGGFLFGVADASILYSAMFSLAYVKLTEYKKVK